jgi:hypothetical protein
MTRGITDGISLGFDDAPAQPAGSAIVDHHFANQVARELHRIYRKFSAAETPKAASWKRFGRAFH